MTRFPIDFLWNRGHGLRLTPQFNWDEYWDWLKEQPCCITGRFGIERHHTIFRSQGNAASMLLCVSLVPELHAEATAWKGPQEGFWAKYRKDPNEIIIGLWRRFCEEKGLDLSKIILRQMENFFTDYQEDPTIYARLIR